jgi:drug/metabolite transporter (DMT)-like permease
MMAEKGLSERYHYQYLLLWYAGGLLFGLAWFLATRGRFQAQEIVMAFGIGIGSFGGQFFSVLALEQKVPGYIVFPMTTGGNLFLVAAAGVFLFREKIGPYGIAGILTGILSLILLSLG